MVRVDPTASAAASPSPSSATAASGSAAGIAAAGASAISRSIPHTAYAAGSPCLAVPLCPRCSGCPCVLSLLFPLGVWASLFGGAVGKGGDDVLVAARTRTAYIQRGGSR
jgi:hypothetical protein